MGEVPEYVHRLLDAWTHQTPLDFKGAEVPEEVQKRLEYAQRVRGLRSGRVLYTPVSAPPEVKE